MRRPSRSHRRAARAGPRSARTKGVPLAKNWLQPLLPSWVYVSMYRIIAAHRASVVGVIRTRQAPGRHRLRPARDHVRHCVPQSHQRSDLLWTLGVETAAQTTQLDRQQSADRSDPPISRHRLSLIDAPSERSSRVVQGSRAAQSGTDSAHC